MKVSCSMKQRVKEDENEEWLIGFCYRCGAGIKEKTYRFADLDETKRMLCSKCAKEVQR